MPYLGNDLQVAQPSYRNIDDISGSFNSSTTSFPLLVSGSAPVPFPINSNQCLISVAGVVQRPDDSGTEGFRISGGNIIFSSAPSTGADFFGVILAGADYVNVGANFPSGSAAVPSITFDSDLDTGIYNSAANQVSITTAGIERLRVDSSGQIESVSLGSASAPAFSFTTDPNTGIYSPGADQVAISTGGTQRLAVDTAATTSTLPVVHPLGAVGIPSITFTGDLNTGIWSPAADTIAASTGGSERARIDSSGRLLVGTTSARSNFVASSVNSAIQLEGSGGDFTNQYRSISLTFNTNNAQGPAIFLAKTRSASNGGVTVVQSEDEAGSIYFCGADGTNLPAAASINAYVDGTPGANDMPGRLVFSTTADGASSPTERMRISQAGFLSVGSAASETVSHRIQHPVQSQGNVNLALTNSADFFVSAGGGANAAATTLRIINNTTTSRSINASGTINAFGADYAEYMTKAGDFTIAKGDVCGVTANGLLTLDYSDAVSFAVKSTNPSYVGGDTWGNDDAVGPKPDAEDVDALAQWEADLEAARQQVDRIAFAGQVPVNVLGATPGQYIVPVEAADGGIEGVAKNEADLTLAEYMRAVGKVIAIEDDGRARIIVKVA